jgi:hypothetical protein
MRAASSKALGDIGVMRVILEKLYGKASLDGLEEITVACAFANTL